MIAKTYKPYRGIGGASYSTPLGPPVANMGAFIQRFLNPDGSITPWSSAMPNLDYASTGFVSPPASVWASLGIQGAGVVSQAASDATTQAAQVAQIAASAGPVITYNQAMANQAAQQAAAAATPPSIASSSSVVADSTNSGGTTTNTPTSSTVFDLFGDSSTPINILGFQIGEYTALGIGVALVVGFMMLKGRR